MIKAIERITEWLGSIPAVLLSALIVTSWFVVGMVANLLLEDKYQLLINTTTTIVTFLMVFIIQNSQNRDSQAVEAKLDEILRALEKADDLSGIEDLPEKEIRKLKQQRAARESDPAT